MFRAIELVNACVDRTIGLLNFLIINLLYIDKYWEKIFLQYFAGRQKNLVTNHSALFREPISGQDQQKDLIIHS